MAGTFGGPGSALPPIKEEESRNTIGQGANSFYEKDVAPQNSGSIHNQNNDMLSFNPQSALTSNKPQEV